MLPLSLLAYLRVPHDFRPHVEGRLNLLTLADRKFTNTIAHNRTIRLLSLMGNIIGDKVAKNLAGVLKVNQTLHGIYPNGWGSTGGWVGG